MITSLITNWIKERLAERSTFYGAVMVAVGAAIIVFGPLTKILAYCAIAYCAIAYGAYTMWRQG